MTENKKPGYFTQYVLQRIKHNKNFIMAICGPPGTGKTYTALRKGQLLDPNFTINQCVFTPPEFMALLNSGTLQPGSVIVFDEAGVGMSSRDWQSVSNKLLNFVFQTFRHKNYILIFTAPHFGFIDAATRKLFHAYAETVTINHRKKTCSLKPFLIQINQRSGDPYYKYLRVRTPEGLVPLKSLHVNLPSPELIEAYEEKKTAFTTKLNRDIQRDLEEIDKSKDRKRELTFKQQEVVDDLKQGLTVPQIAEKRGIVSKVVYDHMRYIKKKGVEINAVKDGHEIVRYEVSENV